MRSRWARYKSSECVTIIFLPSIIHVARHRGKTNGEANRRTPDDGNAIANSALKVSTRVDVTRFISTRTSKCLCSPVALERSLPAIEVLFSRFLYGWMPPEVGQGMLWEGGLKGARRWKTHGRSEPQIRSGGGPY